MESFFSLLQKNMLNRQLWHDSDQFRCAITALVKSTCNHRRRQRAPGKLTSA
jgi:putative transposase